MDNGLVRVTSNTKYIRKYRLTVQAQDENGKPTRDVIVIEPPIGVSFSIDRGIYSQTQTLDISIYNLNLEHRELLFRDVYKAGEFLLIRLEAGYIGLGLFTVFEGFVWSAYSKRIGVDVITQIKAITNLMAQESFVDLVLEKGCKTQDVVDACMKSMPFYEKGIQVFNNQEFTKPVTLAENPIAILKKYTDVDVYVDLMKVNILPNNYYLDIGASGYVITDNSGLLSTPERQDATLSINIVFEPRIMIGQLITINSEVAREFNGTYRVYGINHNGTINEANAGTLTTTIKANVGSQVYGRFKPVNIYGV